MFCGPALVKLSPFSVTLIAAKASCLTNGDIIIHQKTNSFDQRHSRKLKKQQDFLNSTDRMDSSSDDR